MASTPETMNREIIGAYEDSFKKIAKMDEKIIHEIWNDSETEVKGKTLKEQLLLTFEFGKYQKISNYGKSSVEFINGLDLENKKKFYQYYSLSYTNELAKVFNFFLIVQALICSGSLILLCSDTSHIDLLKKVDNNAILLYYSLSEKSRDNLIQILVDLGELK